jgi:purine-binding chemotaxis protein CheW
MSDNDRMDRAKRIREMREGQRDDERDGRAVEGVSGTTASLPSTEEMEAAMEQTMSQAETVDEAETDAGTGVESPRTAATPEEAPGPAGLAEETTTQEAETRVLEFALAGERYCLDIEYIEEIVKEETVTRVPNTPEFVDGVVDLRGQITTILNPKVAIGKDDQTPGDLIVVFDAEAFDDQGAIGWVVDDVRQVSPVAEDQVNDPPMGEDYINGVIDREDDDEFVIWTKPDLALDEAE